MALFPFEQLVVSYFAVLALAAVLLRLPRRRWIAALVSVLVIALVVIASRSSSVPVRVWLPHLYLALGYWTPALLVPDSSEEPTAFESWLRRTEGWWSRLAPPVPRAIVPALELAYLLCYPLVPASFTIVWTQGTPADADRFWLSVLASGYASYVTLPWLVSHPPRRSEPQRAARRGLAWLNALVLDRVSHSLVTFPSGHAAVAAAAATALALVSPVASAIVWILVAGVASGAIVGRYHYTIDVVLGLALGALLGVAVW